MKKLTERAALLLGLAEALNERANGNYGPSSCHVVQDNRAALGLQPSGLMDGVDEVTYLGNGYVGVVVQDCTCGMGGLEAAHYYGHEPRCGLELAGMSNDVAWCIVRNDYEKDWV